MRLSVGHTLCSWEASPSLQGHLDSTSPHLLQDPKENTYRPQAGNANEPGGLSVMQHGIAGTVVACGMCASVLSHFS